MRSEVAAGHRAFVVCPLVGDSLRVEAKSATEEFERLAAGELAGLQVGLMHGQMAPAAREEVMDRFRAGELAGAGGHDGDRGRASTCPRRRSWSSRAPTASGSPSCTSCGAGSARGHAASWCYLLGGEEGNERLAAVAGSTDGFALAEADLRVRGEGTLLGARQKGQSDLRLASLTDAGDLALLGGGAPGGRGHRGDEDPQLAGAPRTWPTRSRLLAQRGRGRVPLQELTTSAADERQCPLGGHRGTP